MSEPIQPGASRTPSNSQIRRAGERLRRAVRAAAEHEHALAHVLDDTENAAALDVLNELRRAHVVPTQRVMTMLTRECGHLEVVNFAQRIKRAERIVEKIARSGTDLRRLQDIGGCRVVLPDVASQHVIVEALQHVDDFRLVRIDDYVAEPRGSGYRAIHLIYEVDGRLVEVQVRTPAQDYWAQAVEDAEANLGFALKDGNGPEALLEYFRVASMHQALEEAGESVDTELVHQLAELREQVRPYYRRRRT